MLRDLDPGALRPGFPLPKAPPPPAPGSPWEVTSAHEQRAEEAALATFGAWLEYTLLAAALDGVPGLTLAVELTDVPGMRSYSWDRQKVRALLRDLRAHPGVPTWLTEALHGWLLRENAHPREQPGSHRLEKAARNRAAVAELEAMVPRTPRPLRRVFLRSRLHGPIPVELVKASPLKCTLRFLADGEGWVSGEELTLTRTRPVDFYTLAHWSYREP